MMKSKLTIFDEPLLYTEGLSKLLDVEVSTLFSDIIITVEIMRQKSKYTLCH